MHLSEEFTIDIAPDRAFERLLDLQNVALCVPGGEIDAADAEGVYPGRVVVKLGPMTFSYKGTVRIAERDASARRAVIEGAGTASGGAERARVRSVMEVLPEGSGSRVRMETELEIRGRAAQMGAAIIGAVSRRMVKASAACLAMRLVEVDDPVDVEREGKA